MNKIVKDKKIKVIRDVKSDLSENIFDMQDLDKPYHKRYMECQAMLDSLIALIKNDGKRDMFG